ncbi:MAG: hypothetical protein M1553_02600 [Firmicutes bacterium]|nr:hypothetical protein [Bacillota bacterium]
MPSSLSVAYADRAVAQVRSSGRHRANSPPMARLRSATSVWPSGLSGFASPDAVPGSAKSLGRQLPDHRHPAAVLFLYGAATGGMGILQLCGIDAI